MIDTEALRKKVIDLAIQGKLTEQLPTDGDAESLYSLYKVKKKEIEESGVLKGRKQKNVKIVQPDSIPYSIPDNWRWICLDDIAEIFGRIGFRGYTKNDIVEKGKGAITISPSNILDNGSTSFESCTYLSWEKYEESPEIMIEENDVIIVKTGSSYGKCGIVSNLSEKATINPQIAVLKYVLCDKHYLNFVLNSSMARKQYEEFVVGAAIPTFSQEKLANLIMPLPPLAEQKRIVEKLYNVLEQIDIIDTLQQQYESDLSVLKGKIIDAGIRGKLTEQLPEDGDAETLYSQIQEEKATLIKEGKIKKEKPLPEISADEIPFEIPKNWKWVRLANISSVISKGTTPRGGNVAYLDSGVGFLRVENLAGYDKIDTSSLKYIDEEMHNGFLKRSILQENDVLISIAGTLGRTGLVREKDLPLNTNQAIAFIRMAAKTLVDAEYISYILNSVTIQKELGNKKVAMAIPNLSLEVISKVIIPLPPYKEQKRIVKVIQQTFSLLDDIDV